MSKYLLSIDQGTTSSRAMLFDRQGLPVQIAQREFAQHFPASGWVEHAPQDLLDTVVESCREVMAKAGCSAADIIAIGIVNQRETTLLWERASGRPLYNAIVWQDRRTAARCQQLRDAGCEAELTRRSGLLLDPYFSATKLAWLLDEIPDARRRAQAGELLFGTVDTWLLWHLTDRRVHATDATNAARTALFNLHTRQWDPELLNLFDIPAALLPEVRDCAADYGRAAAHWLGGDIAIGGVAGDQQAALIGQTCFQPGMIKSTYGTGCFMIMNTGDAPTFSRHRLLTTLGYQLNGRATYALEGSIFMAGATVQWLRDGLKLIHHASESEALARSVGNQSSVYLVPAFTGLGAPYWDPDARGAIFGLSRETGIADVVAAGLQSVAYQTRDLVDAMVSDTGRALERLRVDGGMVANDWVAQCLADTLAVPVDRPEVTETTALGAAYLAGLQAGVFGDLDELAGKWRRQREFLPQLTPAERETRYRGWRDAVARVRSTH